MATAPPPILPFPHHTSAAHNRRHQTLSLKDLSRSTEPEKALTFYLTMRRENLGVDRFSFPSVLKVCSRVNGLAEGKEIHGLVEKLGFGVDPFVQTGLVGMYFSCGRVSDARLVFDKMSQRDVVTWSIMINGYCENGLFDDALVLFKEMKSSNVEPDEMIISTILTACSRARNLSYGKSVHEFIIKKNMLADAHLQTALVTMYASCKSMDLAQNLYSTLLQKNMVVSTAMVTGYSKIGNTEAARAIFNEINEKDLICWSAMISCFAESEYPEKALELFDQMQDFGIKPDQVTILSVISACANLGTFEKAKWAHNYVDKNEFYGALPVNNALIDMYAKCGSLEGSIEIFERMNKKNVITWTSMINAFAIHGDAKNALKYFYQMENENVEPNEVTFIGVLYACSHGGLVNEGRKIFLSISNKYNITPKYEHYGCMVDLFGRANLVREALEVVEKMPMAPNIVIWGSLMAACKVHNEFELGEFAAKRVIDIDPDHDGANVLLSNIYAKSKKWDDVREVRRLMRERGVYKERGCSRIELNNEIHNFLVADTYHKHADEIYAKLYEVASELKSVGYAPNISDVLVDSEEDEKREMILKHSEKLAVCYGLIRQEKGSEIRIIKNLRICEDCHAFMKLVSRVYWRDIIVRDRTRFHHYKDGVCSCKDYW